MKKNKIVILICLCTIAISFMYVAKSISIFKIPPNNSSSDYNSIKSTYDAMFENFKFNRDYEVLEKNLQDEINDLELLKTLGQDEILAILGECTKVGKLTLTNIVFSEIRQLSINNEETVEETSQASDINKEEVFPIEVIDVCIEFNSSYENMILFVNKLQNYGKEISIASISILNNEEGEKVYCAMNLNFYAVKTAYAWLK